MKEKIKETSSLLNLIKKIFLIMWIIYILIFIILAAMNSSLSGNGPASQIPLLWAKYAIYILLIIQALLCTTGIIFNLLRIKNIADRIRTTLVFLALMGILGIVLAKI